MNTLARASLTTAAELPAAREDTRAVRRSSEAVIEFRNVSKRFKQLTAVDNVSLEIYRGEFIALLGPNGAGKTTLVEMLEGLKKPDSGSIHILGKQWHDSEQYLRGKLAGVLQEPLFINKLRVDETVNLFGSFYRLPRSRSEEVLEMVELIGKRKALVETLSGGQRQRLALGVAMLNQPEIMILDEPSTGLDPQMRRATWEILRKLNKQTGSTMILTTHYMEEAEFLCDRLCMMHKGRILTDGALPDLLRQHCEGEVIEYRVTAGDPEQLSSLRDWVITQEFDAETMRMRLLVRSASDYLPRLYALIGAGRLELDEIVIRKKTLDDLFLTLAGRSFHE